MSAEDKLLAAIGVLESQCQLEIPPEPDEKHLEQLLAEARKLVEELKAEDPQVSS